MKPFRLEWPPGQAGAKRREIDRHLVADWLRAIVNLSAGARIGLVMTYHATYQQQGP